ncbi:homoserine kinase [Bacillaceae bacterium Marseille-Q3522]|nr:homoserine kinase [Bacillaceae bacterium Marseille-Q3522]
MSFIIEVPASSANLGPCFDSAGIAVNLYLTLEVQRSEDFQVIPLSEELNAFPGDETNFVIEIAKQTAEKFSRTLPPCEIKMKSEIPLARGLGSSAAAIVAGIELANQLCELQLAKEEMLHIATAFEGHPDNVGPSLFGGLFIGSFIDNEVFHTVFHRIAVEFVAAVPKEELLTKKARAVLPEQLHFPEAVKASSIANVMISALINKQFTIAGKMMKKDLFHQPYRTQFIPHFHEIVAVSCHAGAFGAALSGAGPTMMCFMEKGHAHAVISSLQQAFPDLELLHLQMDEKGSRIMENVNVKEGE